MGSQYARIFKQYCLIHKCCIHTKRVHGGHRKLFYYLVFYFRDF